jgi:hypothetical protein
MPLSGTSRCTSFVLAIAIVCSPLVIAQKSQTATGPKYDAGTETKIKGTIEEVKLPAKGAEIAYLLVKTGTDTIEVYLCPKSFLDDIGASFTKGDVIDITGSKVKEGDGDIILARELVKGTDTLVFRDAKGNPVWS